MPSLRRPIVLPLVLLALAAPLALSAQTPTEADARRFLTDADAQLAEASTPVSRAAWIAATFITEDSEALSARMQSEFAQLVQQLATDAARFDGVRVSPKLRRRFLLLKLGLAAPPPADPALADEMTRLQVGIEADYGRGEWCPRGGQECRDIAAVTDIIATSRDPDSLRAAWEGWRTVSVPMKDRYTRFVALSNQGARTLGFDDTGVMWRSGYDMSADDFTAELERLWAQVRPLYLQLHAYVRQRLREQYGPRVVPADGPIRADLLGNIWAQEWGTIADVAVPAGAEPSVDLTKLIQQHGLDALQMVHIGERFYTSMGFDPLPETFWTRSQLVQPVDHEAVCHASAWDIDAANDVRIKMCITPTAEDFVTIHHELGHNFYQRAYAPQPFLYQNGANDGFHEAIGDAIALSITPAYLHDIGLLDRVPTAAADTLQLLRKALDKVAFLPFGLLVDQWRWGVFSGDITPAEYNDAWWDLRTRYQGIVPPGPRPADAFDPGAKYHVPANVPYTRYFLAALLQFQFYRAMCEASGHQGPLYRCSFYESREAGRRLNAMLELGASKPWPDALEELTGTRDVDAGAMVEYFQPLMVWLERQNRGQPVGW